MATPAQRAARIVSRLEELALISEEEARLTRTFGSTAMREVNRVVASWAADSGLRVWTDAIANFRARTTGSAPRTLLLGSHLDTVRDAGRYDGPLGVLVALDCMAQVGKRGFEIELAGFCDEEGVRFHSTYLGSRALAGSFDPAALKLTDGTGITLAEAIRQAGGQPGNLASCAIARDGLLGYLEVHLEQGPVLEAADEPLGIVTAIAGQTRLSLTFTGRAGHAGTTPMEMRRDALPAAAEFVLAVESIARMQGGLVATVGRLNIPNSAGNVVPGRVQLSLDLRSVIDGTRRVAVATLEQMARGIASRRALQLEWRVVQETVAAGCDPRLRAALGAAVASLGHSPLELSSGAGHDAAALIAAGIPSGMLFVRCRGGVSHHPEEYVAPADITEAVRALDACLAGLA